MFRLKYLLLTNLFLFCLCSISAVAQTKDASLIVTVKDQFDGVIANAVIEISPIGGKQLSAASDAQGIARFSRLPDGKYQVKVSAPGFNDYLTKELALNAGESRKIEATLEVAVVESNVEIGETEVADPEKSGAASVLNERAIENLPDDPQELEKAIRRIGEAVTGEELPVSVNGVQGAKIPSKQSIQQIRINQNVFSAQYDSPFGGGIDIFTRGGIDKFSGYASFSFADSRFNASDPFLGRRVPYQSRNFYFNFAGPLGKKANFDSYFSHSENDSSAVVNATILDANLLPVAFRQSFVTPSRNDNFGLTINADPTKKHKLYLNYNIGVSRAKGQNVGDFSLPSRANDNKYQSHYLQFSDTFLINANVVNQTRLLGFYSESKSFGGSDETAINVLDAFFGGGSQQNIATKNMRFDASNETTWQMGKYAFGFGFRVRGERINQNSTANFGGTFTYSGRLAPVLDANNNPVTDAAGNFATTQITSLESYRRTLVFRRLGFSNQRIRELGGGANQFTISGGNPEITASQYDVAFYVQNSYKLSETVAASAGLRYENQTNIDDNFNLAPRFGLIWAPKAKDKQNPLWTLPRVSVGYGMFYNRFGLNNTLSLLQANDTDRLQYLITDSQILDSYATAPTVDLLQQFALPRTQRFLGDEFATPYQSLLNVTVAKKMPKGFTLNLTVSRGKFSRQAFIKNINSPLAGTYNPLAPTLAVRPFGNMGNIYETQANGRTVTDRISLNLNFPNSPKLFGGLRYGYTKSKSNVVSGSGSPFDAYDFSREFAPTPFDGVHNFGGYLYYNLPHRFSLGGDFSINSGTRFNIYTGRDTNGDGFFSERPAFASNLNKPGLVYTEYGVLDPNPTAADRLIPRNLGRGPSRMNFNGSISKSFGFSEDKKNKKPAKQNLSFSLRVNNVFNIINKANPVGNMSSPNFLRSLSGGSDGSIIIINGAQQGNFVGRSMTFSVGFGF